MKVDPMMVHRCTLMESTLFTTSRCNLGGCYELVTPLGLLRIGNNPLSKSNTELTRPPSSSSKALLISLCLLPHIKDMGSRLVVSFLKASIAVRVGHDSSPGGRSI